MRLKVTPELGFLNGVATAEDLLASPLKAPGLVAQTQASDHIEEAELRRRYAGRVGGADLPDWADGTGGAMEFGVALSRVGEVLYLPGFGAIITPTGDVLKSSVAEALYVTPDLSGLPGVAMVGGDAIMARPQSPKQLEKAAVFMAWGGRFNYGHFILDCLPALWVMAGKGIFNDYVIVAPPLTPWHRDLLQLMLGERASGIVELDDEVVAIEDALFASPMDHFLHAPNDLLEQIRGQIISRLPKTSPGPERLYLSRRSDEKRVMLNEGELEARLSKMGFDIVRVAELSIEQQLNLFRTAKVIVGATGAAFANCVFCAPATKIFEIQPTNYAGVWARGICNKLSLDWHGYFTPSPAEDAAALDVVAQNPGAMFAWRMPVEDFVAFLSTHLDAAA